MGYRFDCFPFHAIPITESPRTIVIDPQICFGKPTLVGRGVATDAIFERFQAGDSAEELADDYGLDVSEVDEAIRYKSLSSAILCPFFFN